MTKKSFRAFISFLFIISAECLYSNGIQFALSFRSQASSTVGVRRDEAHFFELLQDVTDHSTRSGLKLVSACSTPVLSTENLLESANTSSSSYVDSSDDGCRPNVKPIGIIRSQFFVYSCFDVVCPLREIKFALAFQLVREGADENRCLYVLNRANFSVLDEHF